MASPVRLLLVGSNGAVRRGLDLLLSAESGIEVAGQAENSQSAVELGREVKPTIVLVDLESIGKQGLVEAAYIRDELAAEVAVLSLQDDGVTRKVAELAGLHFVSKQSDSYALLAVVRGRVKAR
jgi:DNA-binding NarL/FixJ family response regulator